MIATYEQASFPYAGLLGLLLALACIVYVIVSSICLIREARTGQSSPKRGFQIVWSVAAGFCALLLILVSWNSLSVDYRLTSALQKGQYETWTGTITAVDVEDKGTDFRHQATYKITLTLDDSRQFTCCWLTPEQILLLQKGTRISVGCASQIGSVTLRNGLTVYQSPDAKGNVVKLEVLP